MRQTELHLTDEDRELIESYCAKGLRPARAVNRAHILSSLDRGIPEARIMAVLGVGRTAIWRTRRAYPESGAEYALCDAARPGKPRQYVIDVEGTDYRTGLFGTANGVESCNHTSAQRGTPADGFAAAEFGVSYPHKCLNDVRPSQLERQGGHLVFHK